MLWKNSSQRYGMIAQLLHWSVAALIITQFVLANIAERVGSQTPRTPMVMLEQMSWLARHKSVGMLILGLALVRICWRFISPPPPLPRAVPAWQRLGAGISHWSLYALLFALPLTGWLMSSATNYPVSFFGWFSFPDLVAPSRSLADSLKASHHLLAKILFVLALLHIAAAMKHHFFNRDDVLRRMLPWGR